MKCAHPTCAASAPVSSNYCVEHQPPLPPRPPAGRVVREDARGALFAAEAAALIGFLALIAFAAPDLAAWWRGRAPPAVQTSALVACPPPTEHETRLLYVNARPGGTVEIQCGPLVGGRGAYPGRR